MLLRQSRQFPKRQSIASVRSSWRPWPLIPFPVSTNNVPPPSSPNHAPCPVILSYILQNSVQTAAIVVTGRLGPEQLSAAAFSMMLAFVTGEYPS